MRKFITKTILISIPLFIFPFFYWAYFNFPPPKLSNSLSYNAKILDIKENHFDKKIDFFAVGSSMSLNNINTKIITTNFGAEYLNISSWGQNIEENYHLIKILYDHYTPKTIIIPCNYMDFNTSAKEINYKLLNNYLFGNKFRVYKESGFNYLIKTSKNYSLKKMDQNNYTSLFYDKHGGVNFKKNDFNIDSIRWSGNEIKDFNFDTVQYKYLDSISNFCELRNIELTIIQSPFRYGYFSQLNEISLDILDAHKNKINSILQKNNHLFIDTENKLWEDSLFVDYSHLNNAGSKIYTNYIFQCINKARN